MHTTSGSRAPDLKSGRHGFESRQAYDSYAEYVGTEGLQAARHSLRLETAAAATAVVVALLQDLLSYERGATDVPDLPNDLRARRVRAIGAALTSMEPSSAGESVPDTRLIAQAVHLAGGPITSEHDEVLFVRILQVFEVVFGTVVDLCLEARRQIEVVDPKAGAGSLASAADLMHRAFGALRVLATIRKESFGVIRQRTSAASGLQSVSFKRVELICAAQSKERLLSAGYTDPVIAALARADEPTIESVIRRRRAIGDRRLVASLRALDREWLRWKRAHWSTAARVIGEQPGTGGTEGATYLRAHVPTPLFPILHRPMSGAPVYSIDLDRRSPAASLDRLVASTVSEALGIEVADEQVEQCSRPRVGDHVVDVDAPDKVLCVQAAAAIAHSAVVAAATAVPPRVYVTLELEALRRTVINDILGCPPGYGTSPSRTAAPLQIQFSCPNLNKALHLGHLRNNAIGMALANIAEDSGFQVSRVDQPSNRGRHIAKAYFALERWNAGTTPASQDQKPDHFVGDLYAEFATRNQPAGMDGRGPLDDDLDALIELIDGGDTRAGTGIDRLTRWAYAGIASTYQRIGSRFDAVCPEGETVQLAIARIHEQLGDACWQRPDGSVYVDLSRYGLRPVTILRRGGGPLLHAQFLGACLRRREVDGGAPLLFVMGNEYKDTVPELLALVQEFGLGDLAQRFEPVYHGMVRHQDRKFSSREDAIRADDLLDSVSSRLSSPAMRDSGGPRYEADRADRLGVALVKLHLLRVQRAKDIRWDEEELWSTSLPRLRALVKVLATPARARWEQPATEQAQTHQRALLLALNRLPQVLAEGLHRRDPAVLIRHLDLIVHRLQSCARDETLDPELDSATRVVINRCLKLAGISLPAFEPI